MIRAHWRLKDVNIPSMKSSYLSLPAWWKFLNGRVDDPEIVKKKSGLIPFKFFSVSELFTIDGQTTVKICRHEMLVCIRMTKGYSYSPSKLHISTLEIVLQGVCCRVIHIKPKYPSEKTCDIRKKAREKYKLLVKSYQKSFTGESFSFVMNSLVSRAAMRCGSGW